MFWLREKRGRFSVPSRYGLIIAWAAAAIGVLAAMRLTALPFAQ